MFCRHKGLKSLIVVIHANLYHLAFSNVNMFYLIVDVI